MKLKKKAELKNILTLKVSDAVCDLFIPDSIDDVTNFSFREKDYFVLAGGSNVVMGAVQKPVLYMGEMLGESSTEDFDAHSVTAYIPAGTKTGSLMNYLMRNGFSGAEFMAGIPGTVGGAIVGNAAPKGESWEGIAQAVVYVKDGNISRFIPEFGYRRLENKPVEPFVIIAVELLLTKNTSENVRKNIMKYLHTRIKIPYPSAGSLFKNPEELPAGRLLEEEGFKGYAVNDAALYENHANIVINKGRGAAHDFITLKDRVMEKIMKNRDIRLEPEVRFWR